jgi:anti-sigma factor RsiW
MTHEHEALELAVASLDFELTPSERARMEAGLAACPECAAIAASHGELARRLHLLPVQDASPRVRQRVMRAALVPPRDRRWPVLLAAAALLGLLLVGAVVAGAVRDRSPLDDLVNKPPESPPALGDVVSPAPSGAPSATPSGGGPDGNGSAFGAPLLPDSLAKVVSGRLRVRSQPRVADDSTKYEPLLDVGDRLYVVGGPVVASDYEWYEVVPWRAGVGSADLPRGWVARGDHDGSPWIAPQASSCPSGDVTIGDLTTLRPEERVACFGGRELRVRAYVAGDPLWRITCASGPRCMTGPDWLTESSGWRGDVQAGTPAPNALWLTMDPDHPVPNADALPSGGMAEVVGHFDDPAAEGCAPAEGTGSALTVASARLECRTAFVVSDVRLDADYPVADAAGITVSDNLRVRSAPSLTSARYELLPLGTRVWVLDGPVVADDYEWFQVVVPSIDGGAGAPRVGWVAASDHGGEPWLGRRALTCPDASTVGVAALAARMSAREPHAALGCYRSSPLRFKASVQLQCATPGRPDWQLSPDWLSANAVHQLVIRDGSAQITARVLPALALPIACNGLDPTPVTIDAHLDDPTSESCTGAPSGGPTPPDLDVVTRYWCRTVLVVDGLTPVPAVVPTGAAAPRSP